MKNLKRIQGATLLEVMLVLAIAAMIILMSVRYYKAATVSQQSADLLSKVQAVTAAADQLGQGVSQYSAITTSSLTNVVGSAVMVTNYGAAITVTAQTATTYSISISVVPATICNTVAQQISGQGPRYVNATCTGTAITYTYNAAL